MKKFTAAVFCILLLIPAAASAGGKPTIAVYPAMLGASIRNFDQYSLDLQELARRLEEALRATRRFSVFERNETVLQKWKLEGDIAESGLARESSTEFGKLNNVQLIIQPMVIEFGLGSKFVSIDGLDGMYKRTDSGRLTVTSKVLSTTTGEIKYQITVEDEFNRGPTVVEGKGQIGVYPKDWIGLASRIGTESASSIVNSIFPVQVVHYQSNMLFLNRGEGGGIKVGDELQLFSVGDDLIDPVSKENLGPVEIPIGMVRIVQIKPKTSTAIPIGDLMIPPKPGDIVRH
ncbi:MAG: hypothetical protein CL877_09950 [Dehalococcoidales bacterium]|nr:hypothetical protein [Dehalococcoidales bacterium]